MTVNLPTPENPMRIGTRGSPLAMAQAYETRARLAAAFEIPQAAFEIVVIKVTGDVIQDRPPGGLLLDTYLPREDPRDAFVAPTLSALDQLAEGAVVGTSSLRRRAQLLHQRPDLQVVEFRGNVQTRLKKLADGVAECTFLAVAGLNRLGMQHVPATPIDDTLMLPAVAQGAIGIERRAGDLDTETMLAAIHDTPTGQRLAAERAFLLTLDGSCETPIAGLATLDGDTLHLRGQVLRPDGSEAIAGDRSGPIAQGGQMGVDLAQDLLAQAGPGFFDWHVKG